MIFLSIYLRTLGKLARGIVEDVLVIVGARSRGPMRGTWRAR